LDRSGARISFLGFSAWDFVGPYAGGKHQIMQKGMQTIRVPNPHGADISTGLLSWILRDAGIDRVEWEKL
jgi:predicted RNA binding protein YcfA (HicA-like mRNA interferase family)